MKNSILVIPLLIFTIIAFYFFYNQIKINQRSSQDLLNEKNKSEFLSYQQAYLQKVINVSQAENNREYDFSIIKYFEINDNGHSNAKPLLSFIKNDKKTLIIRYTEIGCNSCTDSTFAILENNKSELAKKYNINILVDFSNIDAYLKWKKVSEINYPIFWLEKGQLPFEVEKGNNSYFFVLNSSNTVNDFFIPDSKFSSFIKTYFTNLQLK
jgi:hypothetical protein